MELMRSALISGVLAIGFALQPNPLLWGGLAPGPYAIGYRSYFRPYSKRRLGPEGGPRPVVVNLWYPAAATVSEDLFGKKRAYLNSDEQVFLEALLSKIILARRDAAPAKGRFPVLLIPFCASIWRATAMW